MVRKSNILIYRINNSVLIMSIVFAISTLATGLHEDFVIAKPPDERQPELVEQGIQQIPTSQAPIPRKTNQPIKSPIPINVSAGSTGTNPTPQPSNGSATPRQSTPTDSNPTPQPSNGSAAPRQSTPSESTSEPLNSDTPTQSAPVNSKPERSNRRSTPRQPTPSESISQPSNNNTPRQSVPVNSTPQPSNRHSSPRQSTPSESTSQPSNSDTLRQLPPANSTSQPSNRPSIPPQNRSRKPTTEGLPFARNKTPVYKEINFVDIAFGVLAPGDFQSQSRYFHFYQFEGRENQLIQIRLTGSADARRSNNLSLNPLMFLLDPQKKVLLTRGSTGTEHGVRDAFIFVRLPVKGTYTIAVTSRNPYEKGRYSLTLRNDRSSYIIDESSQLSENSKILKKNNRSYNVSKFRGKKDQLVSIRVDSIFEQFSPYIILLNSQGKIIASDNDKDGKYSALIDRAKLPEDGTYYVVVISAIPREQGPYRLTIF